MAAGTLDQLAALAADPPEGARLRPLAVAGAFHTSHMAPAVARLRQLANGLPTSEPGTRLLSNADGSVIQHGPEFVGRLVEQVAAPVRWDRCMTTLGEIGVTAVIELPPAGTLVGLIRRALPDVETLALKTPDDLDAARDLIEKHRHAIEFSATPAWRLLVAPLAGIFEATEAKIGDSLRAGAVIGKVVTRREAQEVVASQGGVLVEWLVENGDPVSPANRSPACTPMSCVRIWSRHEATTRFAWGPHRRHRRAPARAHRHQRGNLPHHRLDRRMDSRAQRHHHPPLRGTRRVGR